MDEQKPPEHFITRRKLMLEYLRHLTTLSTGSIVILSAFLEKLSAQPEWKFLVVVSLSGFVVSVLSSVTAQAVLLTVFPGVLEYEEAPWFVWLGIVAVFLVWGGFLTGVLGLVFFAAKNLL